MSKVIMKGQTIIFADTDGYAVINKSGKYSVERIEKGTSVFPFEEVYFFAKADILPESERKTPPKGYPTDPSEYADPKEWAFPINNEGRTRSAISYFSKHPWPSSEIKRKAAKRILSAAKKFGIDVDEKSDVYVAAH